MSKTDFETSLRSLILSTGKGTGMPDKISPGQFIEDVLGFQSAEEIPSSRPSIVVTQSETTKN